VEKGGDVVDNVTSMGFRWDHEWNRISRKATLCYPVFAPILLMSLGINLGMCSGSGASSTKGDDRVVSTNKKTMVGTIAGDIGYNKMLIKIDMDICGTIDQRRSSTLSTKHFWSFGKESATPRFCSTITYST
ncbi:hypothetical protein M8C21_009654, partial [Ambrosia artemisiifolia]